MKKIILLLLLLLLIPFTVSAEEGLIAYYPLADDVDDHSGNNFHGEMHGVKPEFIQFAGLDFKGIEDQYVVVLGPNHGSFNLKSFTVEAWILSIPVPMGTNIVEKRGQFGIGFSETGSLKGYYYFQREDKELEEFALTLSKDEMDLEGWRHIAFTVNNNGDSYDVKLFVDGELKESVKSLVAPYYCKGCEIYIGGKPGYKSFNGLIDEVKIYNYAKEVKYEGRKVTEPKIEEKPPIQTLQEWVGNINKLIQEAARGEYEYYFDETHRMTVINNASNDSVWRIVKNTNEFSSYRVKVVFEKDPVDGSRYGYLLVSASDNFDNPLKCYEGGSTLTLSEGKTLECKSTETFNNRILVNASNIDYEKGLADFHIFYFESTEMQNIPVVDLDETYDFTFDTSYKMKDTDYYYFPHKLKSIISNVPNPLDIPEGSYMLLDPDIATIIWSIDHYIEDRKFRATSIVLSRENAEGLKDNPRKYFKRLEKAEAGKEEVEDEGTIPLIIVETEIDPERITVYDCKDHLMDPQPNMEWINYDIYIYLPKVDSALDMECPCYHFKIAETDKDHAYNSLEDWGCFKVLELNDEDEKEAALGFGSGWFILHLKEDGLGSRWENVTKGIYNITIKEKEPTEEEASFSLNINLNEKDSLKAEDFAFYYHGTTNKAPKPRIKVEGSLITFYFTSEHARQKYDFVIEKGDVIEITKDGETKKYRRPEIKSAEYFFQYINVKINEETGELIVSILEK